MKLRYRLFGMVGSWDEYAYCHKSLRVLAKQAYTMLRYGYDAHIEDLKTGRVYDYHLVERKR